MTVHCWCGGIPEPFSEDYGCCPECDTLVSQKPTPREDLCARDDESGFYGKDYWQGVQTKGKGFPDIQERARLDLSERCLHWLATLLKYKLPPGRTLELGAAHGAFVSLLGLAGFDAIGLELSPWVVDFARATFGVQLLRGTLEQQDFPPASFDIIAHMDVLEHLPDPEATMARCLHLLKPDGVLLVQTPCHRGKSRAQLVADGDLLLRHLIPREHLFLFSERALRKLCERIGATHICFEPAMFGHDMFAVISRSELATHDAAEQWTALQRGAASRTVSAMLDLYQRASALQRACDERLKVIETLDREVKRLSGTERGLSRCLVNLAHLDPRSNGGVSRTAWTVSRWLAEKAGRKEMEVVFVVGWRSASQFANWLDMPGVLTLPYLQERGITDLIRSLDPDVIVSPLFGGDPFDDPEIFKGAPHIVAMPDALVLDKPEMFSAGEAARRVRMYEALRHAALVVTKSAYSRDRLLNHLSLDPDRVVVISNGANIAEERADLALPISGPYVYYPANDWPHKRHDFLVQIMKRIWESRPEIKLALTGNCTPGFASQLALRNDAPEENIVHLGFVPDTMVFELYRRAEAMIFASSYEGFGMPIVEAMGNECPVICAPLGALVEIAGDCALFVEDEDPRAWADVFLNRLPKLRASLLKRGRVWAGEFKWNIAAEAWGRHITEISSTRRSGGRAVPIEAAIKELEVWIARALAHDALFAGSDDASRHPEAEGSAQLRTPGENTPGSVLQFLSRWTKRLLKRSDR